MNFRLLHPTLPAVIIKERQNVFKGLLWIVHNIGKRSALCVFEEFLTCDYQALQYLGFKSDFAEPEPFGINLLQEVMQIKNDELDFLEKL